MPPLLELHLRVSAHQNVAEEDRLHFHLGFIELVHRLPGAPQILEGEVYLTPTLYSILL